MNRKFVGLLAFAALATAAWCAVASAKHVQVPVVRFNAEIEVSAPPSAVWSYMTTGKNLATWCPMWKSAGNARSGLNKVGDVLDFTDPWGNGGRSIVTYSVKDKEMRIAHEPTKGDYMCQAKFILTPTGSSTRVEYWEQYTDESKPEDMEATAKKMEADMQETLAALKRGVEKK
jgi:uncharacterized protein YndB with AHSA1/START domain